MSEDSGSIRDRQLKTMTGAEGPRALTVPIDELSIDENAADEELLPNLMSSMASIDQINPITVKASKREDGRIEHRVVAGVQRAIARKRLREPTIQCTLAEFDDPLRLEQVSIDENVIRKKLSAAVTALLFGRRSKICKQRGERDRTLSQNATASNQAMRAASLETGHEVGSVRDQAEETGESKDKIHRSMRRYNDLGPNVLKSLVGTSLDKGVELDALAMHSERVRGNLVKRATTGDEVSATKALRRAQSEPQHRSPMSERERAENAVEKLYNWIEKYTLLLNKHGLLNQCCEIYNAFYKRVYPSKPPKTRNFLSRMMGRKK